MNKETYSIIYAIYLKDKLTYYNLTKLSQTIVLYYIFQYSKEKTQKTNNLHRYKNTVSSPELIKIYLKSNEKLLKKAKKIFKQNQNSINKKSIEKAIITSTILTNNDFGTILKESYNNIPQRIVSFKINSLLKKKINRYYKHVQKINKIDDLKHLKINDTYFIIENFNSLNTKSLYMLEQLNKKREKMKVEKKRYYNLENPICCKIKQNGKVEIINLKNY